MNKFLYFFITVTVGIGLFYWINKTVGVSGIKSALLTLSGAKGLAIFGLTILMLLLGVWKWRIILKSQGHPFSFRELTSIFLSAFSISFFAPVLIFSGEVFRAYALKEKKSVPWKKAMASVIIDRILEWTCNLAIILAGVIFFIFRISRLPSKLEIILDSFLIVLVIGAVFFYIRSFKKKSIVKIFMKANKKNNFLEIEKEIFNFFKPRKKAIWKTIAVNFTRCVAAFLRCWLIILFLGKGLLFFPAVVILSFYFLATLIPIPASLGSHDALQALVFSGFGFGADSGAAFAMIIRGAELLAALIGIVFLLRVGISLLKNILFRRIDGVVSFIKNSKK